MKTQITISRQYLDRNGLSYPDKLYSTMAAMMGFVVPKGMKIINITVEELTDLRTNTHLTLKIKHIQMGSEH